MNCGEDYVDETITHEIMALAGRIAKNVTRIDLRGYVPGSVPCFEYGNQ
ncbi:hypothetical protein [Methanocalculus sp. MC3]